MQKNIIIWQKCMTLLQYWWNNVGKTDIPPAMMLLQTVAEDFSVRSCYKVMTTCSDDTCPMIYASNNTLTVNYRRPRLVDLDDLQLITMK